MHSRRNFLGNVATGLAAAAQPSGRVLGANDRIRVGIIGPGARGMELVHQAMPARTWKWRRFAMFTRRAWKRARRSRRAPRPTSTTATCSKTSRIDAVLIATPQHLHCEHFIAALDAGKHVYQEKTMAFTVDHAKRMRAAYSKAGKRAVQIGHQSCSSGQVADAAQLLEGRPMGKITAIAHDMYRNTPHGKPQWSRPVYPDMTPENILWKQFLGEAPKRDFDANRYINWRFFWDYSGGNVYENMCHQLCLLVQGAGPARFRKRVTMDGRRLSLEGRARGARHDERRDGAARRDAVHAGIPDSATTSWAWPKMCWAPTAPFTQGATRSATRRRR